MNEVTIIKDGEEIQAPKKKRTWFGWIKLVIKAPLIFPFLAVVSLFIILVLNPFKKRPYQMIWGMINFAVNTDDEEAKRRINEAKQSLKYARRG